MMRKLISDQLTSLGFTLVGNSPQSDLSYKDFKQRVIEFAQGAQKADVALFYYAGHGVQVNGENYLVPVDADPLTEDDVPRVAINASDIAKALGSANTLLNFLILDACRDNPFATRSLYAQTRSLNNPTAGLAEMKSPRATMIWYATEPGKKAVDALPNFNNGPYATAISHYITTPNLDLYALFNKSGKEVFASTNKYQQPWLAASVIDGIYFFRDSSGHGSFQPYDEVAYRALTASQSTGALVAKSLFSTGVRVPTRDFPFGADYEAINHLLDASFRIESWDSLPRAGEYKSADVRYFWVYLNSLPVVQSALANLQGGAPHCIDPQSYIAFFFKDHRFFHSSIRLFRSEQCNSYKVVSERGFRSRRANDDTRYPSGKDRSNEIDHRWACGKDRSHFT